MFFTTHLDLTKQASRKPNLRKGENAVTTNCFNFSYVSTISQKKENKPFSAIFNLYCIHVIKMRGPKMLSFGRERHGNDDDDDDDDGGGGD